MNKPINAKPNINGNTDHDFTVAAKELYHAAVSIEHACRTAATRVFHGRNYQSGQGLIGLQEDARRLLSAQRMVRELNTLAEDILAASKGDG